MKLSLYIAGRYLFSKKSHAIINVISAVSAVGLAIGTAALILILSVYNGFNGIIEDNLSESDPDILVRRQDKAVFDTSLCPQLDSLLSDPQVSSACAILEFEAYLSYDGEESACLVRGVENLPGVQLRLGDISQAVAGEALSAKLGLRPGRVEPVRIYYPDRAVPVSLSNPSASLKSEKVYPCDIMNFGAELDDKLIIIPIEVSRTLYCGGNCSNAVALTLKDSSPKALERFRSRYETGDFVLLDSPRQHPELFRMMRLEKAAVFAILVLIVLIIAFNIFGSLSMLIIEKEEDIFTLRSLGASDALIKRVFLIEGWLVTLSGMIVGTVVGVIVALLQQHLGLVKMPGNFLVDSYPVVLKATDVLVSVVCVSLIGLVIAFFPSRKSVRQ